LPRIDPVIEAFTRSIKPPRNANPAMMSSARLPSVALSRPPIVGPVWAESSSVARPSNAERGRMASALSANTASAGQ